MRETERDRLRSCLGNSDTVTCVVFATWIRARDGVYAPMLFATNAVTLVTTQTNFPDLNSIHFGEL